jgi:6-phosphogluconolactonase (cycloisomerase 2 family)
VGVFPIVAATSSAASSLGSPVANGSLTYWPLSLSTSPTDIIEPTGITALASGAYLYVTAYDSTAGANYIFGFSIGSGGALTALNGGVPLGGAFATGTCPSAFLNAPFATGTCPSAIASATISGSTYLYVTDQVSGKVHGYTVATSTGLLTALGTYAAGDQPGAIVVDPLYSYLYVANSLDSTVTAYQISSGALTNLGTYAAGSQPVAMGIDPSTSHFLYTANYLGSGIYGTVSGFELSPTTGVLVNSKNSPYTSQAQPTAVAAIPHNGTGAGAQKPVPCFYDRHGAT